MEDYIKLIHEYSEEYCHFLEAAYGDGMMSEGGARAVEVMLDEVDIEDKQVLDVGCGLGGLVFYLADAHGADVTGLELNPWMVEEATRRIPAALVNRVRFAGYEQYPKVRFADKQFDVIISKGVLTHVDKKQPLFQELYRSLVDGGRLVIDDWLSPWSGRWCDRIQTMCDIEDLTLYAHTEDEYTSVLTAVGFQKINMISRNEDYSRYNQNIVDRLKDSKNQVAFIEQFDEQAWQEAVDCYQMISDAIADGELLIRGIYAEK